MIPAIRIQDVPELPSQAPASLITCMLYHMTPHVLNLYPRSIFALFASFHPDEHMGSIGPPSADPKSLSTMYCVCGVSW